MIKGIFFDLYDTLVVTGENTASSWLTTFYNCLKDCGLNQSLEDFTPSCQGFFSQSEPPGLNDGLTVYERRIRAICADLKLDIDVKMVRKIADSTVLAANEKCNIDPDCHHVLETLKKKFLIALISNYDHPPYIPKLLKRLDIGKYFSAVVISGEVGMKKPAPGIFQIALQKTGLKPQEVVHVGDSVRDDVLGAASVGIMPVLIQRGRLEDFQWDENLKSVKVPEKTRTIRRLNELVDILNLEI